MPFRNNRGGSIGQSDVDDEITNGLITSGSVDGKDIAFKIFGGYMFNRNFGVEGAYVDLGEVSYSGSFGGAPVTGGKSRSMASTVRGRGFPGDEQFSILPAPTAPTCRSASA